MKDVFKVKFWGTRGSIPSPGKDTVKYGGNTLCVEVRCGDTLIIIDAGTGLRLLGNELMSQNKPINAHVFFSHFHWDHIQGFPFFMPAFVKGNTFKIYGEPKMTTSLEETLAGQMFYPNFPVEINQMQSKLLFANVKADDIIELTPECKVVVGRLNHPGGALSYRIEYKGKSIVYATDTEHLPNKLDKNVLKQANHTSIFIYDSMYTPEEYDAKQGWGHSTYLEGAKIAKEAGVDLYVLFHHEPTHKDEMVAEIEKKTKKEFKNTIASYEGLELNL